MTRRAAVPWCATPCSGRWRRISGRSVTSRPTCSIPVSVAPRPSSPGRTGCSWAPRAPPRRSLRSTRGSSCGGGRTTETRVEAGGDRRDRRRAARVDPHRRAHRIELPVPPLRRRHAHSPLRRCSRRSTREPGSHLGHPQDAARSARPREGSRALGRRREPSRHALRDGAREGQPPRTARHQRGSAASPRAMARTHASRSSASGWSRCSKRSTAAPISSCSTTWRPKTWRSASPWSKAARSSRCPAASRSRRSVRYASTGADLISTSVITQSAPAFDIGLDLDP